MEALDIMKEAYANNYQGSVTKLIDAQMQPDVAITPEEQRVGLTEGPPRPMVFPDVNGQQFNTQGMDYPIDMTELDANGNVLDTTKNIQPGIVGIDTHPMTETVVETPSYKCGGWSKGMKKFRR